MRSDANRRNARLLAAGAAVLGLLLFLAARGYRDHWRTDPPESLSVGAFSGDVGALTWIAKEHGFFDRVGLNVEVHGYASGKDSVDALRARQVDLATASEFVVADRSFAEPDLRILASVCQYWNKGLIGRRDHGIAKPADLKGKRVGVTTTSTAEHTLAVFLAMQGLVMQDIQAVNLAPQQMVEQIGSGAIDAAMTWQPHVNVIEHQLGDRAISLLDHGSDAYLVVLTRQDALPAKAEAFKRFLRALILAEDWIRADPGRARKWLATRFSLDDAYIEKLWPKIRLEVSLPQEILDIMDGEARWLAKAKGSSVQPDYSQFLYSAPLAAIKPPAVTLFSR